MANAAEVRTGSEVSPRHPGLSRVPGVPVAPTVLSMLQSARRGLGEAADEMSPGARYVTAHLAALRAAAAVVAARGEPRTRRRKPHSVWDLLPQVEPALTEWAAYFAAGAGKRAAAEERLAHRRPRPLPGRDCARRRSAVSAPAQAGGLEGQNPSIAPRASESSTPQLMSSSVRSAGDLS